MAAGLRALESTDIAEISLRRLAREAGVSATAVYRHFPDKRALMEAMAREGLAQLARMQGQAAREAGDKAFLAAGRAYVRFALANPSLFRLVFTHRAGRSDALPQSDPAASMLLKNAAQAIGGDEAAARRVAIKSWAQVHGLAMLLLDGQIPADDALIDQIIEGSSTARART